MVALKFAISSSRPLHHCAKDLLLFGMNYRFWILFDLDVEIEYVELRPSSAFSKSLILSPTDRRLALFNFSR